MHMQQKLEEAERKIEEQAALIAKAEAERVKAEAERAEVEAANQSKMAEFSLMHKYMRSTDPKYLAYIATEASSSSSPAPPHQ